MREKTVERKVREWAEANGVYTRKFVSPAHRSVPDRVFAKYGKIIFIEFKKPGEEPSPLQYRELEDLWIGAHIDSAWCDNAEECITNLRAFFGGHNPWENPKHTGWRCI